jgi:amino acid transporter
VSAVVAATSVLLVFQLGQPRIWMSMSRDGLLPKRFSKIHPKFQTPAFATIMTGIIVGIPALFVESSLMTDLTSIGTLFAFVLVCGGVLLLPVDNTPNTTKRFKLPYINSRFIVPVLLLVFLYGFRERVQNSFTNINNESHQEMLFVLFILVAISITVASVIKQFSLIPILGMLCCLYLMIEIPVRSWMVFFGWMTFGLTIYFSYGYRKSKLAMKDTPL